MKKSEEIIGLPVISIEEGDEIGVIGHVIPNVINGSIAGLALKRRVWYQQPSVIPFSFVVGMSSQALTIENKSAVYPLSELSDLEEMLAKGNEIIGLKVITKTGDMLGKVSEYVVDDEGSIAEYQLEDGQGTIDKGQVLTIGAKLLVIDGNVDVPTPPAKVATPTEPPSPEVKEAPEPPLAKNAPSMEKSPANEADRLRQMVGEKQEETILGKASGRTLMADSGAPIIRKGEEVTEVVIAKAKKANRFAELVESTRIPPS